MELEKYMLQYQSELMNNVIPFWVNNSIDTKYGGFFTCLERDGEVFDTDKFVWLQCRQVWMFAVFYNQIKKNSEWLDIAISGAEFLKKHGRDENGFWYFALDRRGEPLVQPYNIFSDCFASMAFAQLYKATGNEEYALIAKETFSLILKRRANTKGIYNKVISSTRNLKGFALPMILSNLALEMESVLESDFVTKIVRECVEEVLETFYKPELGLILENVNADGSFSNSFEGRLLNPGHSLEAMWFLMDIGEKLGDKAVIEKCIEIAFNMVDVGWDKQYGGIFYFLDLKGKPLQQLEWDQKLWWVHIESLVCFLKGYYHTGNERCLTEFKKIHEWTWSHFPDPEYGEWFGYLSRQGDVLLPLKGGKWKGCFHVPRGLLRAHQTMVKMNYMSPELTGKIK